MAQTVKIKSNTTNASAIPASLQAKEIAANILDRSLFIGDGSSVIRLYTGTTKYFDADGFANNALKLGGVAASDYATQTWVTNKGYLSETDASRTYQTIFSLTNKLNVSYISGLATVATSGKYSDLTGVPTSLPASDVYSWAKAATKPSYAFSEITSKPTTLAGYGITDALNTSGGTIKGLLNIYRNNAGIRFFSPDGTTSLGWFGFSGDKTPIIWDGLGLESFRLYHTGNFNPANYLPLSGGTITSASSEMLVLKRTGGNNPYLTFRDESGNLLGRLGFDLTSKDMIASVKGVIQTLIHSGNIGSYNAGSATKLQTARTIWGQSYDGSANVSGNLSIGNAKLFWHNDSSNYYIGTSYTISSASPNIDYVGYGGHRFVCAGSEKMRISNTGNVLIGTTTDNGTAKLQLNGNIHLGNGATFEIGTGYNTDNPTRYNKIVFNAASSGLQYISGGWTDSNVIAHNFKIGSNNTSALAILNNGNVEMYENLTVSGNVVASGTIAMATLSSSDRRLKDNITSLSAKDSLSIIRQLRPTSWNWKKDGSKSYGFVAQEVQPLVKEMVSKYEDSLYLQYNQLHAFEVGAIQHIDNEVEQLKKDLKTANTKIENLENELKQYRRTAICQ